MNGERSPASFRDPSGFVFRRGGILYRQVNSCYKNDFNLLISSGLYEELVSDGLLISHEEAGLDVALSADAVRVLKPEPVPFVSYPYEWCFGQLQDAALTTLEVQKRALARRMTLKDASAFNVLFHRGRPVLIDTLSFETYREGEPWVAYHQFCKHFLAPLFLMSSVDPRLGRLLALHPDGVPLDLASRLLPARSWLRISRLLHIHLHARSIARFGRREPKRVGRRTVGRRSLEALLDNLRTTVRSLRWSPEGTEWARYEEEHAYGEEGFREKQRLVAHFLQRTRPERVWDLGANVGTFSRIAARAGARVVALDGDPGAVERHYRRLREEREERILPLLVDLANPSSGIGWAGRERMALGERGPADTVLALALLHHLAITHNVPLPLVADWLASLGRVLIVEFVPKEDPQARRLLAGRRDVFPDYTRDGFDSAFARRFRTVEAAAIGDAGRRLYLMERAVA